MGSEKPKASVPSISQGQSRLWWWRCGACTTMSETGSESSETAKSLLERHYDWAHDEPMPEPIVKPFQNRSQQ